jgi:hypothetical protein
VEGAAHSYAFQKKRRRYLENAEPTSRRYVSWGFGSPRDQEGADKRTVRNFISNCSCTKEERQNEEAATHSFHNITDS